MVEGGGSGERSGGGSGRWGGRKGKSGRERRCERERTKFDLVPVLDTPPHLV